MAEGSDADSTVTLRKEGLLCQPCKDVDGQQLLAEGYCVTCKEHLCIACFSAHRKSRPSRHHVLQDKTEMPMQYTAQGNGDVKSNKCQLHADEEMTSYCKTHDRLCCDKCILIGHRACSDVKPIADVANGIEESEEFKTFVERIAKLGHNSGRHIKLASLNTKHIDDYYKGCMDDFSATVCKIKDKDLTKIKTVQTASETVLQQVNVWETEITKHRNNKQSGPLFIMMKTAGKDVELMESNNDHVEKENTIVKYGFVTTEESSVIGRVLQVPFEVKQINVKHSDESSACCTRDILFIDKHLMLVTDSSGNNSIKLVDVNANKIMSHKVLKQYPWEMAKVGKHVFVTQPTTKTLLRFMTLNTDLSTANEIPLDGACYTVTGHENGLTVDTGPPVKLVEIDLDGKVKRTIHGDMAKLTNDKGEQFLTNPLHSTRHATKSSTVYTDYSLNSLTEISDDGKARLIVKSAALKNPEGLVAENEGHYIVCSCNGKRVVKVSDDGDIHDVITDLAFNPMSVAIDSDQSLLYVGGNDNSVHVYKI